MKKICDIMTCILFCAFIAAFALLFWMIPDKSFSDTENRALAEAPKVDTENILNGDLAKDMNEYFSDQFICRDVFVKIKSSFELALLKGENNGVLYNKDQLAVRAFDIYGSIDDKEENSDMFYEETVRLQLERVNSLAEKLDVKLITLIPPRTIDIAEDDFNYKLPYGNRIFDLCVETLSEKANYIDLKSDLKEAHNSGEYVIYKTDHHWTTLGAYMAYEKIADKLNIEKIPLSAFEKEEIPDFSGTTAARAAFPIYNKDIITLYKSEKDFEVYADGEKISGIYDNEKAATSDKYSVFLGGTHGKTEIYCGERENILVVKDSFADSLIPFLAEHYNVIALDLKTNRGITEAAREYNAAAVMIVWNAENLITSASLGNLK